jgi:hypothetical protein
MNAPITEATMDAPRSAGSTWTCGGCVIPDAERVEESQYRAEGNGLG